MNDAPDTTNDAFEKVDGRPTLRFERRLDYPIERVWRAVSEPAELANWFPSAVEWTPAVGEVFEAAGETGEITEVDPPRRLAWTYADDIYSFDLQPDGGGCLLVFIHTFDDVPIAQTATGWHIYLSRLEPLLEGRPLSEMDAHAVFAEVHERYAEQFDVDPAPGREFAARLASREG